MTRWHLPCAVQAALENTHSSLLSGPPALPPLMLDAGQARIGWSTSAKHQSAGVSGLHFPVQPLGRGKGSGDTPTFKSCLGAGAGVVYAPCGLETGRKTFEDVLCFSLLPGSSFFFFS